MSFGSSFGTQTWENLVPHPGDTWNGYEILEKVGQGAMGIVFKARQKNPSREVALKFLNLEDVRASTLRRFQREIEILANLDHPNLVKVYAANISSPEESKLSYIAMTFVEGKSLEDLMSSTPLEKQLQWIEKVATTLDYAHENGVVHRDVKPANIMISHEGQPYLVDFGLAKTNRVEKSRLTKTGIVVGTIAYMSPEQAEGNPRNINQQTDIFSLGAILYKIATGSSHLLQDSNMKMLFELVEDKIKKPSSIQKVIPHDLEQIIMKAMAPRAERYEYAEDLATDLRKYANGETLSFQPPWKQYFFKAAIVVMLMIMALLSAYLIQEKAPESTTNYSQEIKNIQGKYQGSQRTNELNVLNQQAIRKINQFLRHKKYLDVVNYLDVVSNSLELEKAYLSAAKNLDSVYTERRLGHLSKHWTTPSHKSYWLIQKLLEWNLLAEVKQLMPKMNSQKSKDNLDWQHLEILYGFYLKDPRKIAALKVPGNEFHQLIHNLVLAEQDIWSWQESSQAPENKYWKAHYKFLQARKSWHKASRLMSKWQWLKNPENSSVQSRVLKYFEVVANRLEEASSINLPKFYHAVELSKRIRLFKTLYNVETRKVTVAKNLPNLLSLYREYSLQDFAFAGEVIMRWHSLDKNWKAAAQTGIFVTEKVPWKFSLYNLQMIAQYHLGNNELIQENAFRYSTLSLTDITPLENLTDLLCNENLSLDTYMVYERSFLRYIFSNRGQWRQSLLMPFFQNFIHRNFVESNAVGYKEMLPIFKSLCRQEKQDVDLIKILARGFLFLEEDEQKQWRRMVREKAWKKNIVNQELEKQIEVLQPEHIKKSVLQALQRYIVFDDNHYIRMIMKSPSSKDVLLDIIQSSDFSPAVRYIAAKAMGATNEMRFIRPLRTTAAKRGKLDFPANLIASCALRQHGLHVKFPPMDWEFVHSSKTENLKFYQIITALSLNPTADTIQGTINWIDYFASSNNSYAIVAAYHQLKHYEIFRQNHLTELENKVFGILKQDLSHLRAVAFEAIWSTYDLALHKTYRGRQVTRREIADEQWRDQKRRQALLDFIEQDDRLAALSYILKDVFLLDALTKLSQEVENQDFVSKLRNRLYSLAKTLENSTAKFWVLAAAVPLERGDGVFQYIQKEKLHGVISNGSIIAIAAKRDHEAIGHLVKYAKRLISQVSKDPSKKLSSQERRFLQIIIIAMGRSRSEIPASYRGIYDLLASSVLQAANLKDPMVSNAAKISMMYFPSRKSWKQVEKLLKKTKKNTLAYQLLLQTKIVYSLHLKRGLITWKSMLKESEKNIPAIVGAYKAYIYSHFKIRAELFGTLVVTERYERFYHYFSNVLRIQDEKTLVRWILAYSRMLELQPNRRYYYECALVQYKLKRYGKAKRSVGRGIRNTRDGEFLTSEERYFRSKLQALRAKLLYDVFQAEEDVVELLINALKSNRFTTEGFELLAKIRGDQKYIDQIQNKDIKNWFLGRTQLDFTWRSYLCGNRKREFLIEFIQALIRENQIEEATWVLEESLKRIGNLCQADLKRDGLWEIFSHHYWVKELPLTRGG